MAKIRVGINGYGTIGKRVADAIHIMPDMELAGIVKVTPDYSALIASEKGIPIYTLRDRVNAFKAKGIRVEGTLENLLEEVDVIVDTTPAGVGARYKLIYEEYSKKKDLKMIFQGGEEPSVADISYNSYCNPSRITGKRSARVVSCNTTGLLRLICSLDAEFGVERVRATIIRRAADPKEDKKGPVNSIRLNPPGIPSHHARDVKTVAPWIDIATAAVIVPTTLMHVHSVYINLKREATREEILEALGRRRRILLLDYSRTGIDSTAKIVEASRDLGRPRYDIPELIVWKDTLYVSRREVWLIQAVHQESIVVPENIDAIRGLVGADGFPEESIRLTDEVLGLGKLSRILT